MSAFIKLVLEKGYDAFTVGEVADRANVGRSTLYVHFTGKQDLLNACIGGPSSMMASIVAQNCAAAAIMPLVDHFLEQRARHRVFYFPMQSVWIRNLAGRIEPTIARLARESAARPLLSPKLVAHLIAEMQIGFIQSCLTAPVVPKSEAIAEALVASTRAMLAALLGTRLGAMQRPAEAKKG